MKINVSKKIGASSFTFQIEEDKDMDALFIAGMIASTPDSCSLCKSKKVSLSGNKAKEFTFVKVKCGECFAQSGLGTYKDGGHFWKDFVIFEKVIEEGQEVDEAEEVIVD